MGDQFWPAVYPGLIVGLLYGLSLRGWANVVTGALGGLGGSAVAYFALQTGGVEEGFIPVVAMIAVSALGAVAATKIVGKLRGA